MLSELSLGKEDILLDVGTGCGEWALAAAARCRRVIGLDISSSSLDHARVRADKLGLANVIFALGSFEEPQAHIDLSSHRINRMAAVYALHHLPDDLKARSIKGLASLLTRPGRMVVGDLMFFEDPALHTAAFEEVDYDGGETDFPCKADFLTDLFQNLGAEVVVRRVHPLVGVVTAWFV
ncbi:MAG: class I SAM-dependent methyltransferase [candidate division Zixibacteria bacterium]|nr:class I SAM-dependent methyltransferase [candidate division Zixibacteria bacterium]